MTAGPGDWFDLGDGAMLIVLLVSEKSAYCLNPYESMQAGWFDLAGARPLPAEEVEARIGRLRTSASLFDGDAEEYERLGREARANAGHLRAVAKVAELLAGLGGPKP